MFAGSDKGFDGDSKSLPDRFRWYIGGLLKHVRAITAVAAPTLNCYRRIQSGEFVYSCASGYTWTPAYASLDPWAGQTIRLRFVAVDGGPGNLLEVELDDIRVMRPS